MQALHFSKWAVDLLGFSKTIRIIRVTQSDLINSPFVSMVRMQLPYLTNGWIQIKSSYYIAIFCFFNFWFRKSKFQNFVPLNEKLNKKSVWTEPWFISDLCRLLTDTVFANSPYLRHAFIMYSKFTLMETGWRWKTKYFMRLRRNCL